MKTRRLLLEAAKTIETLTEVHHCTIKPSKLHKPHHQSIKTCQANSCQNGVKVSEKIRAHLRDVSK